MINQQARSLLIKYTKLYLLFLFFRVKFLKVLFWKKRIMQLQQ